MGNGISEDGRPEGEPELQSEARDLRLPASPGPFPAPGASASRSSSSYTGHGGRRGPPLDSGGKQDAAQANAMGVELLRQGQHLEAVRHFQVALAQEPNSVQILSNVGLAYAKMQDFSSAYEWYERAYKEDTRDVEALFSLAWVERKRQRFQHARELFQKVLEMQPDHQKSLYLLADILKNMQDFDAAMWHFERLVRLDPYHVDAQVSLGQCYEQGKQFPRALQVYSHVLSMAPNRTDVLFFSGRAHYMAKQYRQSLTFFDRVSDTDARGFDARTHAAKACRELEDHARAVANAERAAALWAHPDVLHFLGEECLRLGDERKAAKWFSRTLGADPNHPGSLLELGQLLSRQGRWQEADSHLSRLCELDRSNVVAIKSLALAKFQLQQFDPCRQCCDAALRLEPLSVDALWLLAELRRTGAIPDDDRWYLSLRTPPDVSVADLCQTIARGYLVRKQVQEAATWLEIVKRYVPSDQRVQEALTLLASQGSLVNPQTVLDALGSRRISQSAASSPQSSRHEDGRGASHTSSVAASPGTSPPSVHRAAQDPAEQRRGGGAGAAAAGAGAEAAASSGQVRCSRDDLERLLWRAERASTASSGKGGGKAAVAAAAEHWAELLTCAKAALRQRPDDALAARCAARSLLSTGGSEGEIRGYAARAAGRGAEADAPSLGYELHCFLARCAERDKIAPEAERHYAAALGSKPGDAEAQLGLARLAAAAGDAPGRERARRLYEQVAAASPDNSEALIQLAEHALAAGEDAEAYRLALRASQVAAPSDVAAIAVLGRACARTGRHEDAFEMLQRVIIARPTDDSVMLELAALCRKTGKDQDALGWYRRALDLRPGDFSCNLNMGQVHAARGAAGASQAVHYFRCALQSKPPAKETAEIYRQMGSVQIEIRAWKDAQQTLEAAVREAPDVLELWRQLLTVYGHLQDTKGQQLCHRQLARASGSTVSDRLAYGELRLAEGALREAREHFEKVLVDEPDNAQAMVKLATCWRQDHGREGHLEEARRCFERAVQLSPRNLEALEGAAYCHRKSSSLEQAALLYQRCLEVKATAEGPLYYLGELLYRQHRHAECQHYLLRLVDSSSSLDYKIVTYYLLAKSYVSLDEYVEAEKHARAGLSLKPTHPHTLFILALIKNRMGEYDAAIANLKQALQSCEQAEGDQLRVEIHDWLAQAYERKSEYALATAEVEKALAKDPSHVSSLITRGLVHVQLKQLDQAETALRRALAVDGNHALALTRLGYCRLLASDHREAARLFQRAAEQRCGTVALPNAVKGSALVYLALTQMALQDVPGALARLADAKKSHKNFAGICAQSKPSIVAGECAGLVQKLRSMPDLDLNMPQAWQLVHLMAKELESDFKEPARDKAPVQAATPGPASSAVAAAAERRLAAPASAVGPPAAGAERRQWPAPTSVAAPLAPPAAGAAAFSASAPAAATPAVAAAPAPERRRWAPGDVAPVAASPPEAQHPSASSTSRPPAGGTGSLKLGPNEQIDFSELVQKECLGQGGFGAVYRGLFKGQEVAIKKLFCEDGGSISPLQLQELEAEVAALRGLSHPRLVAFIAACLQPPNLCIVTEFMPNGSLHHLLHKAKTPLTLGQQAKMALQVCEGVAFLHSQVPPVVHRDLKSLNIVLDHSYNAKICDFGLTQSMEKTHISLKEGGNGGSPRYMAPECYDCKGKITEKVDVWALGCILVEIFGGPLPYDECCNIQQIVAKVLIDKQLPYIPHHLPRGVRPIVEDCFHFDIKLRTTAQDAYSRLRQLGLIPGT